MGIASKIGSFGYGLLSSKGARKAGAKVGYQATANKGVRKIAGNSNIIKTTAQTIGSKVAAIAGGKATRKLVARAGAKALDAPAMIAGKFVKPLAIAGVTGLGGIKIYDYLQDVRSKTPEQRQAEDAFDLYKDVGAEDEKRNKTDSQGYNANNTPSGKADSEGDNFSDFYDNMKDTTGDVALEDAKAGRTKMTLFGVGGLILAGAGAYLLLKKKRAN